MAGISNNTPKKHICVGILAHVDAGKTTLAESLLYLSGRIRNLGRVDHKDAFLDTYEMEQERGITIFSKQAQFCLKETEITLLDTPGHVDFSAEMERTLNILDYAVLVISGADGVQGHTKTLWRLLEHHQIPVFIFVNKMDQEGTDKNKLLQDLNRQLGRQFVDLTPGYETESVQESLAECDDRLLETYLNEKRIEQPQIASYIKERSVFPCCFGSALKLEGVDKLLEAFADYMICPVYPEEFGARVYKIGRDEKGNRLTYLKVTGGTLKVRMPVQSHVSAKEQWEEKINQIRIYSGSAYQTVTEAGAGSVCAAAGLEQTVAGEGLGIESGENQPILEPVLTYQLILPKPCDVYQTFLKLKKLEEEEPQMQLVWKERLAEIHVKLMGEVQMDVFKRLMKERYDIDAEFGESSIVYKETIEEPVEGVGHFEPLRHYAEVHLLLEPLKRGSGLVFDTSCSEDMLDKNWQRLVLTHLAEKQHKGALTGSEIADMKITLIAGRAHQKHTEGGDFRQAVYRAVRHGLKRGVSILLEPIYEFTLEVPKEAAGRAISDIQRMYGEFSQPEDFEDMAVITGSAPVAAMQGYQTEMLLYTRGRGRLSCRIKGYEPCHNEKEVVEKTGYDFDGDTDNPAGSVFCSHGSGFTVPWDEVEEYMHLDYCFRNKEFKSEEEAKQPGRTVSDTKEGYNDEKELLEIFERTYGRIERKKSGWEKTVRPKTTTEFSYKPSNKITGEHYLLVDGYNIIFAWDELKEVAEVNMEGARNKLLDILSNYQGYKKVHVIVVFDAYKVRGNTGSILKYHNIDVVFTKEAETADQYIEKTVPQIVKKYRVTVATSDALEQVIIMGQGADRMPASALKEEIESTENEIREKYLSQSPSF